MELLRQQLIAYRPWNEQEERDREELLRRLDSHEDLYTRDNAAAHFTASAWVVSPDRKQVLMAYHRLYDSWAWLGGHADGDRDLLAVALREVREESGLTEVRPVSEDLYSLEILTVDGLSLIPRKARPVRFLPPPSQRHLPLRGGPLRRHPPQARREQPGGLVLPDGRCGRLQRAVVPGADLHEAER